MNWTKLLYVLILVLLYIPMVFLGANVVFPKYTGNDGNYYSYPVAPYYAPYTIPTATQNMSVEEKAKIEELNKRITDEQKRINDENNAKQKAWEAEKQAYEGMKYRFVAAFNLLILIIALFITMQDSVIMGLFLSSVGSTFAATIRYFDSRNKIAFVILVVTFFFMIYFINKKKDTFMDWKTKG